MKKLTRKVSGFKGWTMGLDVHKAFIEYCVLDERGEDVQHGRLRSNAPELETLVGLLQKKTKSLQVCLEFGIYP